MIRLIKLLFLLSNVFVFLAIDAFIGTKGVYPLRVFVHSISFSILVYAFGGLEKRSYVSRNEMLYSYGLSFLVSTGLFLMFVAILYGTIGYYYLFATAIYSLVIVPFMIHYLYYRYFFRINSQKVLVIGDRDIWEKNIFEILTRSLGRLDKIEFCSPEEFINGNNAGMLGDQWSRVMAIKTSDLLYRKAKNQNIFLVSAGGFAEKTLLRIPLSLINSNEDHYTMTFEDIGIDPLVRILDVAFSILILIAVSPFLLFSIMGILLIDRMPVLYRQERRGYRSRKILIYKLTTMKLDPNTGEYLVTQLGRLLRVTRLNEIPQLFNVVRGDMSLVGPRPDIESTYMFCMDRIPYYHYRTNVLPGITGHAQVHYKYVDRLDVETFTERLSYDLYYVKNYSIYLYVISLMKTVGSILLFKGK